MLSEGDECRRVQRWIRRELNLEGVDLSQTSFEIVGLDSDPSPFVQKILHVRRWGHPTQSRAGDPGLGRQQETVVVVVLVLVMRDDGSDLDR